MDPMTIGDFALVFGFGAFCGGAIATVWYWTAAREARRQRERSEELLRTAAHNATQAKLGPRPANGHGSRQY